MLLQYLRRQYKLLVFLAADAAIFAGILSLYAYPAEAVGYAALLCVVLGLLFFAVGYAGFLRRHKELEQLKKAVYETVLPLPHPRSALEADYQALLNDVCAHRAKLLTQSENSRQDLLDYYTLWAHQIKTPIAAGRLLLQSGGETDREALSAELLKIEEYVEMVLGYLRLDSDTTDYVLRRCELDGIIRASLRRYARLFILKKLTLEFHETNRTLMTDEKWLGFVLGQVLSNAIKYTPEGGTVRIYPDGETLAIADNGIGIRPEDLPRVFEKGFTGYNGREDRKATGIGLYLSRRVLTNLGHGITIVSRPGAGTIVRLLLHEGRQVAE